MTPKGRRLHRGSRRRVVRSGVLLAISGAIVLGWADATLRVLAVLAVLLGIRAVGTGLLAIGMGWQLHRLAARQPHRTP